MGSAIWGKTGAGDCAGACSPKAFQLALRSPTEAVPEAFSLLSVLLTEAIPREHPWRRFYPYKTAVFMACIFNKA